MNTVALYECYSSSSTTLTNDHTIKKILNKSRKFWTLENAQKWLKGKTMVMLPFSKYCTLLLPAHSLNRQSRAPITLLPTYKCGTVQCEPSRDHTCGKRWGHGSTISTKPGARLSSVFARILILRDIWILHSRVLLFRKATVWKFYGMSCWHRTIAECKYTISMYSNYEISLKGPLV